MFKDGDVVRTNQVYFEKFSRSIVGTVVTPVGMPINKAITIVRWETQQGNIIPDHQDQAVFMMTEDLEKVVS